MFLTQRVHPFPFRTRKLSFAVPKILGWRRPGKIGQRRHKSLLSVDGRRKLVILTQRVHPFPFRTRKLSFAVPIILGWRRPGKVGHSRHIQGVPRVSLSYSSLAQSVERMTVNHDVAGSSPAGGAKQNPLSKEGGFLFVLFTIHYSSFIIHLS